MYSQVQTVWNPTRSRRDIQENSNLPIFGNIFGLKFVWQLQESSFPIKLTNWWRQSWKHNEAIDIGCTAQIRHPSRGMTQKRFLYMKQVVMRASGLTAMPRSILPKFPSEKITSCYAHLFLTLIFRQAMVAFVFVRIVASVTSLGPTQHNSKAGLPFVGWCMIKQNAIQIRTKNWAGHSQATAMATPWLAQLIDTWGCSSRVDPDLDTAVGSSPASCPRIASARTPGASPPLPAWTSCRNCRLGSWTTTAVAVAAEHNIRKNRARE